MWQKFFFFFWLQLKQKTISISGEIQSKQIARRFMATCFPITNATFLIVKRFSKSIFFSIKPSPLQLELRRYGGRVCSFLLLEFQQYIFLKFNWRLHTSKKLLGPCFFQIVLDFSFTAVKNMNERICWDGNFIGQIKLESLSGLSIIWIIFSLNNSAKANQFLLLV